MANSTITPSAGGIRLTTNKVAGPLIASLLAAGFVSGVSQNIFPPAGSVASPGASPYSILNVAGAPGSAAATGALPSLSYGSAASVSAGALNIVPGIAALATGVSAPSIGAVTLAGGLPLIAIPNITVSPPRGTVTARGIEPTLLTGLGLIPSGAGALAGATPSLGMTLALAPVGTSPVRLQGANGVIGLGIRPASGAAICSTALFNPIVSSDAGSLVVGALAPILSGPTFAVPPTGMLLTSSSASSITMTVPAPPCAALVAGGSIPVLAQTHVSVIPAGPLALMGVSVTLRQNQVSPSPNGALSLSGRASLLSVNLLTPTAILGLTGVAGMPSMGTVLMPSSVAMTMLGTAGAVTPGGSFAPATATGVFAGGLPALSPGLVALSGSLSLTGSALGLDSRVTPVGSSIGMASNAPTVNGRAILSVPAGTATLVSTPPVLSQGIAPTVAGLLSSAASPITGLSITPMPVALAMTPAAPAEAISGVPKTQTGGMAAFGVAPISGLGMPLRTANLVNAGAQPVVNSLTTLTVSTGVSAWGSDPSTATQVGVILPPTGLAMLSADSSQLIRSGFASGPMATVIMSANVPLVYQTTNGIFAPGTATLTINGQPSVIPLYTPDDYHRVLSPGPDRYTVKSPG